MARVIVLAALATKADAADHLARRIAALGIETRTVDISLQTGEAILDGAAKRAAMDRAASRALEEVGRNGAEVTVGIGGGTGSEVALAVLRALPAVFPKLLVTTLPFDPRPALADNSIILVPTLADIAGLNPILRETLENTALMAAGLCRKTEKDELENPPPSVGITALGATEGAVGPLTRALADRGRESAVFHSNGYGGAAFARFAAEGTFDAIIDLTPHELTRSRIAGAHVNMPERFSAGGDLPRVVLPGALNFIGLGEKALVPRHYLDRPHYEHSGFFTHVKVTPEEMELVSSELAESLNALTGPRAVIVPMGGFSHHDRSGGAIEDPELRRVCAETLSSKLNPDIPLTKIGAHLFDESVTTAILAALDGMTA